MSRAGDRARYLLERAGPGVVDPILARLDLSDQRWTWSVLIRHVDTGAVAHRARWDHTRGELGPRCGVHVESYSHAVYPWTVLPGPVAAPFAHACRRCPWPTDLTRPL